MVAPHDVGDLVRSLVRVPGSGSEYPTAGSECLDLARASSLAASVVVPTTLPPALATPKVTPPAPSSSINKFITQEGINAGISKITPVPKKVRIVKMTPQELQNNASRIMPINSPAGPVLYMTAKPQSETSPPVSLDKASLSVLMRERDNLKRENKELQRRLSLFQQLFKDKKRLTSVVKRLGV